MSARDLIEVVRVAVIVVHDQGRPSVRGGHPPSRVGLTASSLSRPLCRLPKGPYRLHVLQGAGTLAKLCGTKIYFENERKKIGFLYP
jgi:hypothetical protein